VLDEQTLHVWSHAGRAGWTDPLPPPFRLLKIGPGAFTVKSPFPFPVDHEQRFEFALSTGCYVVVRGMARQSLRVHHAGAPMYVTRFDSLRLADGSSPSGFVHALAERRRTAALQAGESKG
jgi:hypothetical protein